jgi:hypothetical protein
VLAASRYAEPKSLQHGEWPQVERLVAVDLHLGVGNESGEACASATIFAGGESNHMATKKNLASLRIARGPLPFPGILL